jgi:tRNA threonylcarbamoyladenosine biosynthesis protein TsaB
MRILALDTASAQCSVALLHDGEMRTRAVATQREHARLLLPMVDELLLEAGLTLRQLDGIAFGRGPGSFTGVRVAAGVTQGLALGADLKVRPVSDLRALAAQARRRSAGSAGNGRVLACMDARMGEVYWGFFALEGHRTAEGDAEYVGPPGAVLIGAPEGVVVAAGMGLAAYPELREQLALDPDNCFADAEPHARDVALLASIDLLAGAPWLDAAAAQPVYVRDEVAKVRR